MLYVTSIGAIRRGLAHSELRLNILRICARKACTIQGLIHAPDCPGIRVSIFLPQSEINVSVELGGCKARGLLVRVGEVPEPIVTEGYTGLLRTSLFAFLLPRTLPCRARSPRALPPRVVLLSRGEACAGSGLGVHSVAVHGFPRARSSGVLYS